MRTSGVCAGVAPASEVAAATGVAAATEVSDEELPHNSRTAGETGSVRSPAWNSERKTGAAGGEVSVAVDAEASVTGVTVGRFLHRAVSRGARPSGGRRGGGRGGGIRIVRRRGRR